MIYDCSCLEMTETTPIAEDARWPRWVWGILAMLAIVIGGGLGFVVAHGDDESASEPAPVQATLPPRPESKPTIEPILPEVMAPPAPAADHSTTEPVPTTEPAPTTKPAVVHHVPIKPKPKQKPNRTTPCNVYDHMDGC